MSGRYDTPLRRRIRDRTGRGLDLERCVLYDSLRIFKLRLCNRQVSTEPNNVLKNLHREEAPTSTTPVSQERIPRK